MSVQTEEVGVCWGCWGMKGWVEEGGRRRRGKSTFYAGGHSPRPNCASTRWGKLRGRSVTGSVVKVSNW